MNRETAGVHRAIALLLLWAIATREVALTDDSTPFPEPWAKRLERVRQFAALRRELLPATQLTINDAGMVHWNAALLPERYQLVIYYDGGEGLVSKPDIVSLASFVPGIFGIHLQSFENGSYQKFSNLLLCRVVMNGDGERVSIRLQPDDATELLPNDWFIDSLDFANLRGSRHQFRGTIKMFNEVVLSEGPGPVVTRNQLDPDYEKLLWWYVYRNGERVDRIPAEGVTELKLVRHHTDQLVVMVVAESGGEKLLVSCPLTSWQSIYPDSDGDGIPDYWENEIPALDYTNPNDANKPCENGEGKYLLNYRRMRRPYDAPRLFYERLRDSSITLPTPINKSPVSK
jgi:hypothetical protein